MHIVLGRWTQDRLNNLMHEASDVTDSGERIKFLSRFFLGVDYKGTTLIGDEDSPEFFVINLDKVDCFTFIDYIEAMRISVSFPEFKENLQKVRYREGKIAFENRNHFFTDWIEFNSHLITDVTGQVSDQRAESITKTLNLKENGSLFINGIQPRERKFSYIPSDALDEKVLSNLKTGDYAGIYSKFQGLDVSHVGIVIKEGNNIYIRHACSDKKHRKVLDQDINKYMANKPGLVVLRPKP
ncbi:MAG TPA: DUF1460 domain-containing protein [Nitrospirae bacterium]|nr:DUF1460 domain-containing protein [Nitrospirota bacterium]